jgi:hypothetical protein
MLNITMTTHAKQDHTLLLQIHKEPYIQIQKLFYRELWLVSKLLTFKHHMQSSMQCSQHTHFDCDFALDLDWDLDLDLLFLGSDLDLERDRDLDLDLERSRDLLINEEAHQLLAYPPNLNIKSQKLSGVQKFFT